MHNNKNMDFITLSFQDQGEDIYLITRDDQEKKTTLKLKWCNKQHQNVCVYVLFNQKSQAHPFYRTTKN